MKRDDISYMAFHLGCLMGVMTKNEEIEKFFVDRGLKKDDLSRIEKDLNELAECFYKEIKHG